MPTPPQPPRHFQDRHRLESLGYRLESLGCQLEILGHQRLVLR